MKQIFTKGMTVREIEKASEKRCAELMDMYIYLNCKGAAAADTFHLISSQAVFADTIEELKNNLIDYIENERVNDSVKKNINNFIKNFL